MILNWPVGINEGSRIVDDILVEDKDEYKVVWIEGKTEYSTKGDFKLNRWVGYADDDSDERTLGFVVATLLGICDGMDEFEG